MGDGYSSPSYRMSAILNIALVLLGEAAKPKSLWGHLLGSRPHCPCPYPRTEGAVAGVRASSSTSWLHGFRKLRFVTEETLEMQYAFFNLGLTLICYRFLETSFC